MLVVEEFNPRIEAALIAEPWRSGSASKQELCHGELDFDGTQYWECKECRRIGKAPVVMHMPVATPGESLKRVVFALLGRSPAK